ncbi:MAG: Stp1/IreP family PP2C-type Ser/Thr phosphatase [Chloroflexi bacterium]|nr:Stp1/IreP family PP2C-type Ser/Thr phosphatase [Chloroflexota bacterium]
MAKEMHIRMWPFGRKDGSGSIPRLLAAGRTDVGRVRAGNEDSYKVLSGEKSPVGIDALLVVADGMGGHAAGEVASRMAVEGIVGLITGSDDLPSVEGQGYLRFLGGIVQQVNGAVFQASQDEDKRGMGTTCTVAVVRGDQLYVSHVGDSRAYLLRAGSLHQITQDHSWVEEQVALGLLGREEARAHPNRNIITRAVGLEQKVEVDGYLVSLADKDILLLCSDGLTTMIEDSQIESILSEHGPAEACRALISAANCQGGHDNVTVAVARVTGGPSSAPLPASPHPDADTVEIARSPSVWRKFSRSVLRR